MPDSLPSFAQVSEQAGARSFDEVDRAMLPPQTVVETHRHPFALWARVTEGEMWLGVGA
ncbi:hypothetical protein G8A07_25630 [Roseateles sp. DAIF2]|uniref:hypothetical protein n=1 Tax=Roseateles sp. DAIF2 TaxID=2714952 RepID=UPI0018A2E544|nr:hypothetical protein [Roseateles sp. DAIF2]QPF75966.1 hypothetical protein G8A07_25630 [Roseateles sp. DAIF2]